jgi:putative membrane protein
MYVSALANVDLTILIPMVGGLAVGAVVISFTMSLLFKRFYTASFSVIFGIFLSMIPNMLTENCVLGWNGSSVVSVIVLILGVLISWFLGDLPGRKAWIANMRNRG